MSDNTLLGFPVVESDELPAGGEYSPRLRIDPKASTLTVYDRFGRVIVRWCSDVEEDEAGEESAEG